MGDTEKRKSTIKKVTISNTKIISFGINPYFPGINCSSTLNLSLRKERLGDEDADKTTNRTARY